MPLFPGERVQVRFADGIVKMMKRQEIRWRIPGVEIKLLIDAEQSAINIKKYHTMYEMYNYMKCDDIELMFFHLKLGC